MYHTDRKYRSIIDGKKDVSGADVWVCKHRGDEVPPAELARYGLNPIALHYRCGRGLGVDGIVCVCRECGPKCEQYEGAIGENEI